MSTAYVSGRRYAIIWRKFGIVATGISTPLKKTIATRRRVAGGIASGISLKGADMQMPNAENANADSATPKAKRNGLMRAAPENGITINEYANDRTMPKKKPPNILPIAMVVNEAGAASNLSKVPVALSNGSATD
jgi:hypothetical protein